TSSASRARAAGRMPRPVASRNEAEASVRCMTTVVTAVTAADVKATYDAVREPEIRTQVEDDRAPILHGPAARELRNAPAGRISSGEGDVKQVAQPGAVGVGLEPGVEAPRIAVEGDDQPAGRGRHLAAAGGERAEQRQNNAGRRRRFDSVRNALVACP